MQGRTVLLGVALAWAANGYALAQAPTTPRPAPPAAAPAPGQYCADAAHRQFDFWLGDWNVTSPDGKPLGTNQVTSIMGNCVLQEHWLGAKGMSGTSFNTYSLEDRQWHQMWVTDRGATFQLAGGLQGNRMVMTREIRDEGSIVVQRWSWEKVSDDKVIQRTEISEDGGKTWKPGFEGIYTRKKP